MDAMWAENHRWPARSSGPPRAAYSRNNPPSIDAWRFAGTPGTSPNHSRRYTFAARTYSTATEAMTRNNRGLHAALAPKTDSSSIPFVTRLPEKIEKAKPPRRSASGTGRTGLPSRRSWRRLPPAPQKRHHDAREGDEDARRHEQALKQVSLVLHVHPVQRLHEGLDNGQNQQEADDEPRIQHVLVNDRQERQRRQHDRDRKRNQVVAGPFVDPAAAHDVRCGTGALFVRHDRLTPSFPSDRQP